MTPTIHLHRPSILPRLLIAAALIGTCALAATMAYAGACPADRRVADGKGQPPGPNMPQGVTDVVRASTEIAKAPYNINGRLFRLRELKMLPGAVVPWHTMTSGPR